MTAHTRVMFVDDDKFIRDSTRQSMELDGIEIECFSRPREALTRIQPEYDGVVVSDIKMPGMDGLELFRRVGEIDAEIPVILITGHGDIPMAVQAIQDGAYDFIEKPFNTDDLIEAVRRACDRRRLCLENRDLRRELELQRSPGQKIIGDSRVIQKLRTGLVRLAKTDADILLMGETGTGKDLAARSLHDLSERRKHPFVAINCGALPAAIVESELFGHVAGAFTDARDARVGKFEHANGGTVFLDEIESMPIELQVKLLRVLQERAVEPLGTNKQVEVDIRVIAATKTDLKTEADEGRFREDLYYRLNVITLKLPTLRERVEDIPPLFRHYTLIAAARYDCELPSVTTEQLEQVIAYAWPGNVRELKNVAERFVLMGDDVLDELGAHIETPSQSRSKNLQQRVEWYEKALIEQALAQCSGIINSVTELLGVPRKTLYDKMQKYGIDKKQFK